MVYLRYFVSDFGSAMFYQNALSDVHYTVTEVGTEWDTAFCKMDGGQHNHRKNLGYFLGGVCNKQQQNNIRYM